MANKPVPNHHGRPLVQFNWQDFMKAVEGGLRRHRYHNARDTPNVNGPITEAQALFDDINGCIGEIAIAIYYHLPWVMFTENYQRLAADVGGIWQARSTTRRFGRLILHKRDPDNKPFMCCRIINGGLVELAGWRYAKFGKKKCYWKTNVPWPCYMVPASDLLLPPRPGEPLPPPE